MLEIETYIEGIREVLDEMEEIITNSDDTTKIDLDNFIEELKKDDLYTEEIKDFINHYVKYHNN